MTAYGNNSKLAAYQSVHAHGGVAGADPHALVMMLLDTAIERMTTARGCIERGEIVRKAKLLNNCVKLIAELRGSLNLDQGGPVAQNLSDLYEYMIKRLLLANANSDARCITEVLSLIGEIRAAWVAIAPEVKGAAAASSAEAAAGSAIPAPRPGVTGAAHTLRR